ncbi:hypothetical protein SAMN04488498_1489 [Mesorhizobium albiziae]|uniref:Uncharacterized protein n=1 Tax=Neomesorhizobium albiziae TaxID=335020 RepID=A0A1I4FMD3_9HYPH|nr:hypothetical protein [Mesorhizobium albiziae]SFL17711.1 hypothetical protein SAMN04488498_1489 [Mesorhizobium albiziae]
MRKIAVLSTFAGDEFLAAVLCESSGYGFRIGFAKLAAGLVCTLKNAGFAAKAERI